MQKKLKQGVEKREAMEQELDNFRREREVTAAMATKRPEVEQPIDPVRKKQRKMPVKEDTPSQSATIATEVQKPAADKKPITKLPDESKNQREVAAIYAPKVTPPDDAATLIVNSNVIGAKVYIDKKEEVPFWASPEEAWQYMGNAPFKTRQLSPGTHEIRVHEEGMTKR
ncbi:MAG: hypothetical protein U5R49_13550 [Deltaproteobacteria bacterium]|nr:hypothetical protein [Deltaproteobacteria bacterium]